MFEKSKILIIGGTGYMGKFLVEASARLGHPTFVLVRKTTLTSPHKSILIDKFNNLGVTLIYGDIHDRESLLGAIKQVDVVISTLFEEEVVDGQLKIIDVIKEAGNIKRFLPSDFGDDVDRVKSLEPAASLYVSKAKIRRKVEWEGIPFTHVVCNNFFGYFLSNLSQLDASKPPRDKVVILGDGNTKAIYVWEEDVATYTIKAVDDPRTLNKILYIRPPSNILSFNELVSMWESKIRKTLDKSYVSEDEILKKIQDAPPRTQLVWAVYHSVYINGANSSYEIDGSFGVEASEIYPEVVYKTVDEYLDQFVSDSTSQICINDSGIRI